jgi:hypothetical protein
VTRLLSQLPSWRRGEKSRRLPNSLQIFKCFFPLYGMSPYLSQNKTMILKKMPSTKFEIKIEYQTMDRSNFRNRGTPYTCILKKMYD